MTSFVVTDLGDQGRGGNSSLFSQSAAVSREQPSPMPAGSPLSLAAGSRKWCQEKHTHTE